jgi:hypothetical protein
VTRVRVRQDELLVEVDRVERCWAVRSLLEIPLAYISGVLIDPGAARAHTALLASAARPPTVWCPGTFVRDDEGLFWDVQDPDRTVVIVLADGRHTRVVVGVDDPAETVDRIERALAARS